MEGILYIIQTIQLVPSQSVTLPTKYLFFIFITNVAVSSVYANNHKQF